MGEWKRINGRFTEGDKYSHTTLSPNGDIWLAMYKTPKDVRLYAGFANNYELPVIVISCENDEKMFLLLQPLIQNVISCSPIFAPFSALHVDKLGHGAMSLKAFTGMLVRDVEEHKYKEAQKKINAITPQTQTEQPQTTNRKHSKHKRKSNISMNGEERNRLNGPLGNGNGTMIFHQEDEFHEETITAEHKNGESSEAVMFSNASSDREEDDSNSSSELDQPPSIVNRKKLELTKDEWDGMLLGLQIKLPTRFDIPYDLRLIVWNPPYDKKELETNKVRKTGPARYKYKVAFGKFFKENILDFKTLLVANGYPTGKKETVLLFDNIFYKGNEAEVEIPRSGKKMASDVDKVKLGALLVDVAELKVNSLLGYTTVFTWDVVTIEMKGSDRDSNQNMYLVNMQTKSYKGQQDPAELDENSNEENNPS